MAAGLKTGYPEIFRKNEYANKLEKNKLADIVVEITGLERNNPTVRNIVGTFTALNSYANFDGSNEEQMPSEIIRLPSERNENEIPVAANPKTTSEGIGMNLSYTINLNLPESTNIEVFNTIFRSLKENLLQ